MTNKTWLFLTCCFFIFFNLKAMADDGARTKFPGGKSYLYRISLSDKKGTPYSLLKPWEFLSQKSIDRRARQGLSLDSTDLPQTPAYLEEINMLNGVEIICKSKWNNTVLVLVHEKSHVKPIGSFDFVVNIQKVFESPDSITPLVRYRVSEDLDTRRIPEEDYGMASTNIDLVKGRPLHKMGFKGRGMTIAVLDGGFMNVDRIPAMEGINILGFKDFVAFKSTDFFKEHDHGTRVLSTMAIYQPGIFVGTAPEAGFWLLRAEDTCTESLAEEDYWAAAAEFADSVGADVISSSLGFQDFDDDKMDHTYPELDGSHALISRTASRLASKGIVHVNSAGNDGMGTWKKINFPADAHDILAVGAVNEKKKNAVFSSVGPSNDGRVKPDIMALGSGTAVINGRGNITNDMGTSFAAPIISGLVACLWQADLHKTASEIMDAIRKSSDNYDTPNNVFGYGIPDFDKAFSILKQKQP